MGHKREFRASTSNQAEGTSSEGGIDRFSVLPEEVAHRILSLLNFKDLTRVGALSKRCRQFHLSVPVVDFGTVWWTDEKQVDLATLMISFDRYLHLRGHNRLQRVCIGLGFYASNEAKKGSDDHSRVVLKWIRNAIRCNVEELDVHFSQLATNKFSLPSFVFHSQSLRSLLVSLGIFDSEAVEAPSLSFSSNLHYLSLSRVRIEDKRVFQWISCCCKCIKELHLYYIKAMKSIAIESSSLESFSVSSRGESVHLSISCEKLEQTPKNPSDPSMGKKTHQIPQELEQTPKNPRKHTQKLRESSRENDYQVVLKGKGFLAFVGFSDLKE